MARRAKLRRTLLRVAVIALAIPALLYSVLMSWHLYAIWKVSRALTHLESIRLGAPAEDVYGATKGLRCGTEDGEFGCFVRPGVYDSDRVMSLLWHVPGIENGAIEHTGLRFWFLGVQANLDGGVVRSLRVNVWVDGNCEKLGATWRLAPSVIRFKEEDIPDLKGLATRFSWYHITSIPSGEGYELHVTPTSSVAELEMRHINLRCLVSLRGCTSVCALLPRAKALRNPDGTCMSGCLRQPVW